MNRPWVSDLKRDRIVMKVCFRQPLRMVFVGVLIGAWMVLFALLTSGQAWADNKWTSRELQIIVPNQPGGGLDLVARRMALSLTSVMGRAVVVVNIAGASDTSEHPKWHVLRPMGTPCC